MQEIAYTDFYTLAVDTNKNRIYCTVIGNSLAENAAFIRDWERAKSLMNPGFTVLTDISRIQHVTKEWVTIPVKLYTMLIYAGLAGTAEVLSERVATELHMNQRNRISRACYTKEEIFTNRRMAEVWLDRICK
ncbi:MAG: hypothetical protein GY801_39990 [bacterium]|nr:hypothetical protein [bacterium]